MRGEGESMELKQQIEHLQEWACEKANNDCKRCIFSIDGGDYYSHNYYCPFDDVITAAEDKAKEESENHQTIPHGIIVKPRTMYEAMRDTTTPITADIKEL